jgi:hypothetical protein
VSAPWWVKLSAGHRSVLNEDLQNKLDNLPRTGEAL